MVTSRSILRLRLRLASPIILHLLVLERRFQLLILGVYFLDGHLLVVTLK